MVSYDKEIFNHNIVFKCFISIGYRSRGGILVVLEPERSEGTKTTNILT